MSCEGFIQIHRYHDGELAPDERQQVELHLAGCAACRDSLAAMASLGRLVQQASREEMPANVPQSLHRMVSSRADRALLRTTGWLTAAAAAVLLVALLRAPSGSAPSDGSAMAWETVAVTPPRAAREELSPEPPLAAQWMADEFSKPNGELR